MSEHACSEAGGTYQGEGSTCVGSCEQTGACCLPSGGCTDGMLQSQCLFGGGRYQGDGSTCAGASCAQTEDLVAGLGAAASNPNQVRTVNVAGQTFPAFDAYAAGGWGVDVGTGDFEGTGASIVTGPGPGTVFGPHARAFTFGGQPLTGFSFYAYGTLKYGLAVASGDLESNGADDVLAGAGPGQVFGPHVRAFRYRRPGVAAVGRVNFFAYGTLKYGVKVTGADRDGDGDSEIFTGPGPSGAFSAHVRGFDLGSGGVFSLPGVNFNAFASGQYGAELSGVDLDGDGFGDLAVVRGPDPAGSAVYRGYAVSSGASLLTGYEETPFATSYGGRVGTASLSTAFQGDLVVAEGPDPAAATAVRAYTYRSSALQPSFTPLEVFPGLAYGVSVEGGDLGLPTRARPPRATAGSCAGGSVPWSR